MEEAQGEESGSVGDAAEELASAAEDDFRKLDFTFHDGALACRDGPDGHDAGAVLVTQRQEEQ